MWCGYTALSGDLRKPFFMTVSAATICPATVAAAAPAMPISGRPSMPKISSGSNIILVTAPAICAIIGVFMSPPACSTFVQMLSRKSPKLNTQTTLP